METGSFNAAMKPTKGNLKVIISSIEKVNPTNDTVIMKWHHVQTILNNVDERVDQEFLKHDLQTNVYCETKN